MQVGYAGLKVLPLDELLRLQEAINNEVDDRREAIGKQLASKFVEQINDAIDAGFALIIEDEEGSVRIDQDTPKAKISVILLPE